MSLTLYMKEYVIYFCLALFPFACLQSAQANDISAPVIEGMLYLVGNEPFTELAIETKEGEVFTLRGHSVAELKGLQGQWVKLQGKIIEDEHFLYSSKGFLVKGCSHRLPGGGANETDAH